MRIACFGILLFYTTLSLLAQGFYAPASSIIGTTAIHKDSVAIIAWATSCTINRGFQDIANQALGYASVGDSSAALGKAQTNGVVSLGDGGSATLTFDATLYNGIGYDFAVFENGFAAMGGGDYLELAFVEVSSDGQNFFRFPAHSLTDTSQHFGSFGTLDPRNINNLAGKYYLGFGTPFDLEEMRGIPGLNINAVSHIRVVDVIGTKQMTFASYDTSARVVLDPYPTAFPSGGFDLDAVGAIHINPVGTKENKPMNIKFYPNPTSDLIYVQHSEVGSLTYQITNSLGLVLNKGYLKRSDNIIDLSAFPNAIYNIQISNEKGLQTIKVIKQ